MRFYNYINEKKIELTGDYNKDKVLKKVNNWKSDLKKLTKIFRSLEEPETTKDINEWKQIRKMFLKFRNNFEQWIYKELLTNDPKEENYFEREVRGKAWQAIMEINDIMEEGYDAPSRQHGLDVRKTLKKREKIIRDYNNKFRECFKAIKELIDSEQENIERFQRIKNFNYAGVNITFDFDRKDKDEIFKWIPKMENFVKNLKGMLKVVERKGLSILLKDLKITLSLGSDRMAGATYDATTDVITVYFWNFEGEHRDWTLYHELGHRFWFKHLPEDLQKLWKDSITDIKVSIKEEHIKEFMKKYYPFSDVPAIKNIGDSTEEVRNFFMKKGESIENIAIFAHLVENFPFRHHRDIGKEGVKEKIYNEYRELIGNIISSQFISHYANTNPEEAWSESIAIWLTHHLGRLPDRVRYLLKNIFESMGYRINEVKNLNLYNYLNEDGDLPSFVTYDKNINSEAQYFSLDDIRVGDKFYNLSRAHRKEVIIHEIGHEFSDQLLRSGKVWEWNDNGYFVGNFNGHEIYGINGQTIPGEIVAEAYAVFHTEPKFLQNHYPDLYDELKKEIKKFNNKLPKEIKNFLK